MKGTDVTPEQLSRAEAFLSKAATMPSGGVLSIAVDHLIRRLAWYGAIRAKSGRETLRQAHTDIMNLLANLDVMLEADSDGMSLEDDDRAIVEDIRRRWMEAMKTKEKA